MKLLMLKSMRGAHCFSKVIFSFILIGLHSVQAQQSIEVRTNADIQVPNIILPPKPPAIQIKTIDFDETNQKARDLCIRKVNNSFLHQLQTRIQKVGFTLEVQTSSQGGRPEIGRHVGEVIRSGVVENATAGNESYLHTIELKVSRAGEASQPLYLSYKINAKLENSVWSVNIKAEPIKSKDGSVYKTLEDTFWEGLQKNIHFADTIHCTRAVSGLELQVR